MLNCFCNVLISIIIIIVKLKKNTQIKIDTKHRNLVRFWLEWGQNKNMVGMRSEYGRNMVGMRSEYGQNMVGNDLKIHLFSTRIPLGMTQKNLEWLKIWVWIFIYFFTQNEVGIWSDSYHSARNLVGSTRIPTILLGSARNVWGRVKYWKDGSIAIDLSDMT